MVSREQVECLALISRKESFTESRKGNEEESRCNKACIYDKMEEVQVFLLDGLYLLDKLRNKIEVLKIGEGFKLLCEIKKGNPGHIQNI